MTSVGETQPVTLVSRGHRAVFWSTAHDVAVRGSGFSWDVRGYYRTLGIRFPYVNATQADLSKGYMAVDGQGSHWATYALKQLLDRETRARYDGCHLGEVFEDKYAREQERIMDIARRVSSGESVAPPEGWDPGDTPEDGDLDFGGYERQDAPKPSAKEDLTNTDPYPYGVFFVGPPDPEGPPVQMLAWWQHLIREEARSVALKAHVALGLTTGVSSWTVGDVGSYQVVLLSQDFPPNPHDAKHIVAALSAP